MDFSRELATENEKIVGNSNYEEYFAVRLVRGSAGLPTVDFYEIDEIMNKKLGNKELIIDLFPNALNYYVLTLNVGHLKSRLLQSYAEFRKAARKEIESILLGLTREIIQSMRLLIY